MFGHWVVLQVTALWRVSHMAGCVTQGLQSPRGLWKQCPGEVPGPVAPQTVSLFCPQPSPGRPPGPPISPAQPFTLKALSLPCPAGGFDVLLSISELAPVVRAHWRLSHQVLVCARRFEVWSWFGSSRCQAVWTENLWNQSLSVRELKWIVKQHYSPYGSLSILWCRDTTGQLRSR